MVEIGVAVTRLDLSDQSALVVQRLFFKSFRIERFVVFDRMDVYVGQRRGYQFRGGESLVELLLRILRIRLSGIGSPDTRCLA